LHINLTFWLTLCFKIYWILLFLEVFIFIFNGYDKNKCFKKSVVGYIVSCGYSTRIHTHTRGNSVAHVWMQVIGFIVGWTPEFFGCLGYIVSCGYPTRTYTRGNSVAHAWMLHEFETKRERSRRLSVHISLLYHKMNLPERSRFILIRF